ncbi:MAG: benzoyl-CoA-dihydrodiol lyase [Candidatus Rokubacteria bacterium]|nr:benzoyl-CoA-dihydrodiol lyase [Candidatus Rokubacteria bacterium]
MASGELDRVEVRAEGLPTSPGRGSSSRDASAQAASSPAPATRRDPSECDTGEARVDFRTEPSKYRHWKLSIDGRLATLAMDVKEDGGLRPGYDLKLNSYDLGVDIELYDAVQRLRFEHPEVGAVIVASAKERIFCAGANIRMLGQSSHGWKVNFCKFTNETRNAIEEATAESGQFYLSAINGPCAGGGYEIALATGYIIMADDGNTSVALPEVPLLAVLPGTGGLTRLVDKRHVRRDRADFFCTLEEGIKGKRALEWGLVDELVPRSKLEDTVKRRAAEFAARSDRPAATRGITLAPLARTIEGDRIAYSHVTCQIDSERRVAEITVAGPAGPPPADRERIPELGCGFWPLALARELDDLILHLRTDEEEIGLWVFRTAGSPDLVEAHDRFLAEHQGDWLVREIRLFLKRTFKRLDVASRSLFALIEPGSCFVGTLLELGLAADRAYMLAGTREGDERPTAMVRLSELNFGAYPMGNGLSRLASRFLREPGQVEKLKTLIGADLDAGAAAEAGLVTFTPDDIDWDDEVRLAIEGRAALSPDALTGLEASLRFGGPETLETKIFGRLSAWQNWIFQRPNAVGPKGALSVYGTGRRSDFDWRRV